MTTFVWDATLLLHAASIGRAEDLGDLVPRGRHITTDVVGREIRAGTPGWIEVVARSNDPTYLTALASWRLRCGASHGRNEGEASVLAFVDHHAGDDIAVIDDGPARAVGAKHLGAHRIHGSLWLLCRGIDEDARRRPTVAIFCDQVLDDGIRWPFGAGEFESWAVTASLLT